MNLHAIYHIPDLPWAYPGDEHTLTLRLRTAQGEMDQVSVCFKDRYDWTGPWCRKDMTLLAQTDLFAFWTADLALPRDRYRYFFELTDHTGHAVSYDERGIQISGTRDRERSAFQYAFLGPADVYHSRDQLRDAIVYQIFPERFCNGDSANDPPDTRPWGGIPHRRGSFGGDLAGIIRRLDFLAELGINLLYLTPVFQSASNHKYNISDYYAIDPQFGTLEEAKELVRKAHALGIRVFFDAVFNHTGSDFFAFRDILENQEQSDYLGWYHLDSLPVSLEAGNYYTFANGISNMPKLRTEHPEVRRYFYEVGRFWIREVGIDGWRLDVCDEVDHEFWRGFRQACDEEKPGSALVGEIMHEASSFLRGGELDSIMNYPFLYAMTDFFARRVSDTHQFLDVLAHNRMLYMDPINQQLWNLLGSHDTARFLTAAKGQRNRLRLASAFQFLYIGTPYIYYGDEIGLDGGYDPYCRRCMIWDEKEQDQEMLEHYRALIRLRKSSPAFSQGTFREVLRQDHALVFQRQAGDDIFLCAFNNSDHPVTLSVTPGVLTEVTPDREQPARQMDRLELEPMAFRVFRGEVSQ